MIVLKGFERMGTVGKTLKYVLMIVHDCWER